MIQRTTKEIINSESKIFKINIDTFPIYIKGVIIPMEKPIGIYRNQDGNSYLHLAILNKDFKLIAALLLNLLLNFFNNYRLCLLFDLNNNLQSPINLVILSGDIKMLDIFLYYGNYGSIYPYKYSNFYNLTDYKIRIRINEIIFIKEPLFFALENGTLEIFKKLYDYQCEDLQENLIYQNFLGYKINTKNLNNYQYIVDHFLVNYYRYCVDNVKDFILQLKIIWNIIIIYKINKIFPEEILNMISDFF